MKVWVQELLALLRSMPDDDVSERAVHRRFRNWRDIARWIEAVEARLSELERRTAGRQLVGPSSVPPDDGPTEEDRLLRLELQQLPQGTAVSDEPFGG